MKPVRWDAAREVRLDDVAEASAAPGEVVAVLPCGICCSLVGSTCRHVSAGLAWRLDRSIRGRR